MGGVSFSQSLFLASSMRLSAVESTMSESQLEAGLSAGAAMSSSREAGRQQLRSLSDEEDSTLRERDPLRDEDVPLLDPTHAAAAPSVTSSTWHETRALRMPASTAPVRPDLERKASGSQLDDLPLLSISDRPPGEQQSSATSPTLAFTSPRFD